MPKKEKFLNSISWIIMIFAVLLIVSSVLLYFVIKKEESLRGAEQQIRLSAQGGFECEYSEAQKLYPFEDGVLKVTSDRVAYLTLSGNEIYSSSISYKNPQCVTANGYAAVFDLNGYNFLVLNKDKVIYSVPVANQLKSCYIAPNGITAAFTDSKESYGEVLFFNPDGKPGPTYSSANSGYPLSCAFNGDSTMMAVVSVNTSGASMSPRIKEYEILYSDKGIDVKEKAVHDTNTSDILASALYLKDDLYTFAADKMFIVKDDDIAQLDLKFASVNYVTKVGDEIFIVYSDGINQMNKLVVFDKSQQIIYDSDIGSNVNSVCNNNSYYAISVDKRIFVYNQSGNVIADISVDEDILRMNFISGNELCVVSTGGVHTIDY